MLYFGRDFLCGLDPPVLKLKFIAPSLSEYVSVVEQAAGTSAHNIPNRDPFNRQSYSSDDFDWNQPVSPLLKIYLLKKKIFFFRFFFLFSLLFNISNDSDGTDGTDGIGKSFGGGGGSGVGGGKWKN